MPSSDYQSAIGGGLRLKGAKEAGITKAKKKKKAKDNPAKTTLATEDSKPTTGGDAAEEGSIDALTDDAVVQNAKEPAPEGWKAIAKEDIVKNMGKTDAQRRHEEMKRKRLDERLKREGIKTHKERVEELNKYLSGLSEHHDMPRIGPG